VYSSILYHAWLFFPGKEGFISGLIIAGFGIGGSLFIIMSTQLINPYQIEAFSQTKTIPFDLNVANNLPGML